MVVNCGENSNTIKENFIIIYWILHNFHERKIHNYEKTSIVFN